LEFAASPRPEAKDVSWEIRGPMASKVISLHEEQIINDGNYSVHPLIQVTYFLYEKNQYFS
jgi:hypothetical protein